MTNLILMALELVREFNKLKKKFTDICDDDMNEWTESSGFTWVSEVRL